MSDTMLSSEVTHTWSSRPSTNDLFADIAGPVLSYEESGTSSRRAHPHNGNSSGFSPSRNQWREPSSQVRTVETV